MIYLREEAGVRPHAFQRFYPFDDMVAWVAPERPRPRWTRASASCRATHRLLPARRLRRFHRQLLHITGPNRCRAHEMVRVLKPFGIMIIHDLRRDPPPDILAEFNRRR
ncbi:MAG: hypothetical protein R3A10_01925 [Caldilineaceae bacterium]